jgi:serine/threonine protein kinase
MGRIMTNELLLQVLAGIVREEASVVRDERWEKLTHGSLSSAEVQALRELSEGDPDAARHFVAHEPLDQATKDRIAAIITNPARLTLEVHRRRRALQRAASGAAYRGQFLGSSRLNADLRAAAGTAELALVERRRPHANLPLVDGKYRVIALIGQGGLGNVFSALDERGQPVALKIKRGLFGRQQACREAQIASQISSEHAVKVYAFGTTEDDAYIAMESLSGLDLARWIATRGPLPVEMAVDFVLQACDAVAEAHGLGIVHRDIKPANLFAVMRADIVECIKVLDFGLAAALPSSDALGSEEREDSTVVGTAAYMAPERLRSNVDRRSDIWSLGVTLYELLTQRLPFEGRSTIQLIHQLQSAVLPPHELEGIPPGLGPVIVRCLQRNPDERFDSVQQLASALVPFGSERAGSYLDKITRRRT